MHEFFFFIQVSAVIQNRKGGDVIQTVTYIPNRVRNEWKWRTNEKICTQTGQNGFI